MSLALSICVLFLSLMQLVISEWSTNFFLLFGAAAVPVFAISVVPLRSIMYHDNHVDFILTLKF